MQDLMQPVFGYYQVVRKDKTIFVSGTASLDPDETQILRRFGSFVGGWLLVLHPLSNT